MHEGGRGARRCSGGLGGLGLRGPKGTPGEALQQRGGHVVHAEQQHLLARVLLRKARELC